MAEEDYETAAKLQAELKQLKNAPGGAAVVRLGWRRIRSRELWLPLLG